MRTYRFIPHLFLSALVVVIALLITTVARKEQPTPAQLVTGGPKTFTEDFSSTTYRDINYSNASWDTDSGTLSIPANRSTAQALSLNVDAVSDSIEAATLTTKITQNVGTIKFFLSNDAGQTYLPVVAGTEVLFATQGDHLRWKVELERASGGQAPVIDSLSITYRTEVPDHIVQINATSAVQLGIETSKILFPEDHSADSLVVGRDNDVIDAFVATPLARIKNAALLFTAPDQLQGETLQEIQRVLKSQTQPIYIVGGTDAVSLAVVGSLQSAGYWNIVRLGGPTRYETASAIAEEILKSNGTKATHAFITEARLLADAYSASAPAATLADGIVEPILLVERSAKTLAKATQDVLTRHTEITSTTIVGGPAGVPGDVINDILQQFPSMAIGRQSGTDRFGTNDAVINGYFGSSNAPAVVALANGKPISETDVTVYAPLLASLLAAYGDGPLIFVEPGTIPPAQVEYLYEHAPTITKAYVVGDITGNRPEVLEQLYNLISR